MVGSSVKEKRLIHWMLVISLLSIVLVSYLLYLHYVDADSFCDISEGLSCDVVNKSPYSEFPPGSGIPVALLGIIGFVFVIVLLELIYAGKVFKIGNIKIDKRFLSSFIFYLMILSLLFALYLVYTELFLILSICVLCVALDIFIILMLILSCSLRGVLHGKKH